MTVQEQILSILLNSKQGNELPVATNFEDLDSFIIFSNTNDRIERAQKSTTSGLFLIAENNLSDVENAETARENLDTPGLNESNDFTGNQNITGNVAVTGESNFSNNDTRSLPRPVSFAMNFIASPTDEIVSQVDFHGLDIVGASTSNNSGINLAELYPFESTALWGGTATLGAMYAAYLQTNNNTTGTVNEAVGLRLLHQNNNGGTTGTYQGIRIENPNKASGTINNIYQLYLENPTTGDVLNYGIYSLADNNYIKEAESERIFVTDGSTLPALNDVDRAVIARTGAAIMQFLASSVGGIAFGDLTERSKASMVYSTSNNNIQFTIDATNVLNLNETNVGFNVVVNATAGLDATGQAVRGIFIGNGEQITNVVRSTGNINESINGVKTFSDDLIGETLLKSGGDISLDGGTGDFISRDGSTGWTGTFTISPGNTVTIKNGIITDVS